MGTIQRLDRKYLWHPCRQEPLTTPPLAITHGKGIYLYDIEGNSYKDATSSLGTILHGHAHPKLVKVLHQQSSILDNVLFTNCTHQPAVDLCERLATLLPDILSRFFFSNDESLAIEMALKIAYQYFQNKGEERKFFLAFEGAYHGESFGAMSIGAQSSFHNIFRKLLFPVKFISYPEIIYGENETTIEEEEELAFKKLDDFLDKNGRETVAYIMEPYIQSVSGMRLCRPQFLRTVIHKVREYGILVIFDENITGFGRTGPLFAMDYIDEVPDILCCSRGLTGGLLPFACTITSQKIYETFAATKERTFLYNSSYMATPLSCALAVESFHLVTSKPCCEQRKIIEEVHKACVFDLYESDMGVYAPRVLGTIGIFRLGKIRRPSHQIPYGAQCQAMALEHGILLQPIGNTIYLMPPYCISAEELYDVYDSLQYIIQEMKIYTEEK